MVNGVAVFAAAAAVLPLAIALFVVGGLANGVETVAMRSLIVHRVADRFRGRAFASYGALVNGMQIGATAAAGALVAGLGGRTALLIGGVGTVAAGIAGVAAARVLERREVLERPELGCAGDRRRMGIAGRVRGQARSSRRPRRGSPSSGCDPSARIGDGPTRRRALMARGWPEVVGRTPTGASG